MMNWRKTKPGAAGGSCVQTAINMFHSRLDSVNIGWFMIK